MEMEMDCRIVSSIPLTANHLSALIKSEGNGQKEEKGGRIRRRGGKWRGSELFPAHLKDLRIQEGCFLPISKSSCSLSRTDGDMQVAGIK